MKLRSNAQPPYVVRLLECFPLRTALVAKTQLPAKLTTGMKRAERGPRAQGDSTLRHVRELIFEYTGVLHSPAGLSTPRPRYAPRVRVSIPWRCLKQGPSEPWLGSLQESQQCLRLFGISFGEAWLVSVPELMDLYRTPSIAT